MSLFTDRRGGQRKLYDLGGTQRPTHDPTQGLAGWASTHADANTGLAASFMAPDHSRAPARTVLPGQPRGFQPTPPIARPTDFTPNIVSPAEQRASMRPSGVGVRRDAWAGGSMPTSQTVVPGAPLRTGKRAQNVLPQVAQGPSFAQKIVRSRKARLTKGI